ncbi:hypothetical protein LJR296_008244 [Cupriavidus necator]|uniref:hypothetical protein n=1 Tax=Cupriavidus necator TaxID=106590 RepID=UPI003ECC763C
MSDFRHISVEFRDMEAKEARERQAARERETAARAHMVVRAREAFEEAGVYRYLREQADAMKQEGYSCRYARDVVNFRANVSIAFVAKQGEHIEDRSQFGAGFSGETNTHTLNIVSDADGAVRFETWNELDSSARKTSSKALSDLTLDDVKEAFRGFVREAFVARKLHDDRKAIPPAYRG